ncbi:SafA/ExsA family spore coat assembly protein, partial [Bacillus cytotoxicus]|nr:SafA/ExsA family spore coat assembly protein [Bacillus cytotoxicus]
MKIHIVQKGDTLWKIAKKYGVDFETLKIANTQLSNPDLIMPGMKIKVPSGSVHVKKNAGAGSVPPKEYVKEVQQKEFAATPTPLTIEEEEEITYESAPITQQPAMQQTQKEMQIKSQKEELIQKEAPIQKEKPIQKEAPIQKEKPIQKEAPIQKEKPIQKEAPIQKEKPIQKEAPIQKEKPIQKEAPIQKEKPIQKEAPIQKEKPIQKEAPIQKEGLIQKEAPIQKEKPTEVVIEKPPVIEKKEKKAAKESTKFSINILPQPPQPPIKPAKEYKISDVIKKGSELIAPQIHKVKPNHMKAPQTKKENVENIVSPQAKKENIGNMISPQA